MLVWIFLFLIGTRPAVGQVVPSIDDLSFDKLQDQDYDGRMANGAYSWPKIKIDYTVTLKPGAGIFKSTQDLVNSKSPVTCRSSGVSSGRLVWVSTDGMAVVKLEGDKGKCKQNLYFVNTADVQSLEPSDDKKTEASTTAPRCPNCSKDSALHPLTVQGNKDKKAESAREKTPEKLEKYLGCYPTKHQDDYNNSYKKLIDLAGKVFQLSYMPNGRKPIVAVVNPEDYGSNREGNNLPFLVGASPNVMKCLVLRESKWDSSARSSTGALGLGQQVEQNVEDIHCLIEGCKINGQEIKPKLWAQEVWNNFFVQARKMFSPAEWNRLNTNPLTKKPCRAKMADKLRDAPCPLNSLAALAISQLEIELTARQVSKKYHDDSNLDFSPEEHKQLSLLNGTSHNAGIGNAAKAVKKNEDPNNWSNALSGLAKGKGRGSEVRDYRQYLNNCLSEHNWKPMEDGLMSACARAASADEAAEDTAKAETESEAETEP